MRHLRLLLITLTLTLYSALTALAQEDDKGFLTRTLQDALSGAGRNVSIEGFQGALSSEASFERMTIADADGIWLTLEGARLVWNRSALLRGRLEVESLTADRLDIPRLPVAEPNVLPAPEAAPFALPDLPVSIDIRDFGVAEISLGAALLGEAAVLRVQASAQLTDAIGDLSLKANRLDGKQGRFDINAQFDRGDGILDLLLDLNEGAGGLAARALSLPGQPAVALSVKGQGPIDDFASQIELATDGAPRITGQVVLGTQASQRSDARPDRLVNADISGDITTLLAPRYRAFFGDDVGLTAQMRLESSGAIEISSFELRARAAELRGSLTLNAEQWPTALKIKGQIADPDGTPILLPIGGEGTRLSFADLDVIYDAARDDRFMGAFDLKDLTLTGALIGTGQLRLDGQLNANPGGLGQFLGDIMFDLAEVDFADPALKDALGAQIKGRTKIAFVEGQALSLNDLQLLGRDFELTGALSVSDFAEGLPMTVDLRLGADNLSRFSALAGRNLGGQSDVALTGQITLLNQSFDLDVAGSAQDIRTGITQADAVLAGRSTLNFRAQRNTQGTFLRDVVLQNPALNFTGEVALRSDASRVTARLALADAALLAPELSGPMTLEGVADQVGTEWAVDLKSIGPNGVRADVAGVATGPNAALDFRAELLKVSDFVPDIPGAATLNGTLRKSALGWDVFADAQGPYASTVTLAGALTPNLVLEIDARLPDARPIVPQLAGPLQMRGEISQHPKGLFVDLNANGPHRTQVQLAGLAAGPDMALDFELGVPNIRPFAPGMSGPVSATGDLRQAAKGILLRTKAQGPYGSRIELNGRVTGPDANMQFDASLPNLGVLVDKVSGPLQVTGTAQKSPNAWLVDTNVKGPSGTRAAIAGRVMANGNLDMTAVGAAPLGLSAPFIAPRRLQGQARFDLALVGPPRLSALTGTVQTVGATFSAPNLRLALKDIAAGVQIERNRATLDVQAAAVSGGTINAEGAVVLTGSMPADLQIALQNLALIDPQLYQTALSGDLRISGPLRGGATIAGQIRVSETNVSVPSTGMSTIGEIPLIQHIRSPAAVTATRQKAGLSTQTEQSTGAGSGPAFGLDIGISAPNRIFVRGRGLDAELGGQLQLSGTTARVISTGRFDLLRGRLDILGKRFDLREGSIQFLGDLVPYLRFVSATSTRAGEARIVIEGDADDPAVSFEATPEAPQDEVLAQLLFGRRISDISPFQALQLASAVATLAGRGGTSVISKLRSGFGLDDLDVTTTDSGATAVRAGKYISENIYSDVTAASDGTGEVSLNIDLTPNLTGKAILGSDGETGIGIFFEKDY